MSSQMEKKRKSRGAIRGSFTRGANELEQLLQSDTPNHHQIEVFLELLLSKSEELKVVDSEIYEVLLEQSTEEELMTEIESCDSYRKRMVDMRIRYGRLMKEGNHLGERPVDNAAMKSVSAQMSEVVVTGRRKFKLPTIEFKRFDGNVKDWLSFWAQFKKIHEDEDIDEHDKIGYLIQATIPGSRARQLVESFPAMAENYQKIIEGLYSRFGREDLQIEVYVRELLKLILSNAASSHKIDISTLYDQIETHLRALETLGITSDKCSAMLFPLIESCLPQELLRVWQRSSFSYNLSKRYSSQVSFGSDGDQSVETIENRLQSLMHFLRNEVENEQRIALATEGFGLKSLSLVDRDDHYGKKKQARSLAIPTAAGFVNCDVKCVFCDGTH